MSNTNENSYVQNKIKYEIWLINELKLTEKEARIHCNSIVLLEGFATRRQFKVTRLFSASIADIDLFLSEFYEKMSDNKKGERLIESVVLLRKFAEHADKTDSPKKTTQIKNNIPDAMEYSAAKSKTPEGKLIRRLNRKFKKCKYIGDIQINDEEYDILKVFFKNGYSNICQKYDHSVISITFAVALVQIGIRFYDGKFWPHIKRELGIEKLDGVHQNWIGTSFYKTLLHYDKFHVDENEYVNNILLHCFITKYYADDLFDFLFAYYQIDLDRDLTRNNSKMRKYLMQSMSKGETSARAYKIKRHTADAVSANEKGCKIRIGRILRFMDNALFNDVYPTTSQNRIAQLFCLWAASSKKFDIEKKHVSGLTNKGIKQYSTLYLHFDVTSKRFFIILPHQYIHLEDDEALPQITWKIIIAEQTRSVDTLVDSCVTGCKTEKISDFSIDTPLLMHVLSRDLQTDQAL